MQNDWYLLQCRQIDHWRIWKQSASGNGSAHDKLKHVVCPDCGADDWDILIGPSTEENITDAEEKWHLYNDPPLYTE